MADAPKINSTDTLRESYPKLNQAIDNANEALRNSEEALNTANQALANSENTQEQLDQIVIEGDSSVEAAQARVDADGNVFTTLKERLDTKEQSFTAQLAQEAQKLVNLEVEVREELNNKRDKSEPVDLDEMTPRTLAAIEGGEGTSFNLLAIPKSRSVSPGKTTFIIVSTNLFNKEAITPNKGINTSGEEYDNPGDNISEYIEIEPEKNFIIGGTNRSVRVAWYDENKVYRGYRTVYNNEVFTSPSYAYFMRMVVATTSLNTFQLNRGNTLLPYEEYYTKLDVNIETLPENVNIFTKDLPNIENRKLIFYPGNLRIMYRNKQYLVEVTTPIELNLTGEWNHIFFDPQTLSFKVYIEVGSIISNVPNYYIRIGLVQYTSMFGDTLKNVQLPFEYAINGTPATKTHLLNSIQNILNNSASSGTKYILDTPIVGHYQSNTDSDYSATSHYTDSITINDVYEIYDEIAQNNPEWVKKIELGNDSSGQYPMYCYEFTNSIPKGATETTKRLKIIFLTGTHGEEGSSVIALRDFMKDVADNWQNNELLEIVRWQIDLVIIPVVNPYGLMNKQRKNYNGVDLNRQGSQFWEQSGSSDPSAPTYKGTAPFSEVEAQYVKQVIEKHSDATAFFDFHMNGTSGNDYETMFWHSFNGNFIDAPMFDVMIKSALENITFITREAQKKHGVPMNSGYCGYISRRSEYLSTLANYAYGQGIPGYTIECTRKIPGETDVYSNSTLRLCTTFIGNHILNIIRNFAI